MPYDRIRSMNKRFLNPLMRRLGVTSRGPFAVVRHTGRRSGRLYETPIIVMRRGDGFVIALTYGPQVDWYRNVLATGGCSLLWHGQEFKLEKPEPLEPETALSAFPQPFRGILKLRRTMGFISLSLCK